MDIRSVDGKTDLRCDTDEIAFTILLKTEQGLRFSRRGYEEFYHLGYNPFVVSQPQFRRNMFPSPGSENKQGGNSTLLATCSIMVSCLGSSMISTTAPYFSRMNTNQIFYQYFSIVIVENIFSAQYVQLFVSHHLMLGEPKHLLFVSTNARTPLCLY
jgi:hypothetical protein